MKPLERDIQDEIRRALGRLDPVRMWRNSTGALTDSRGRLVRFGLAVGSADLVGITVVPVASLVAAGVPEIGVFTAIEVKRPGEKPRPEQERWLSVVREAHGVAAVSTSPEEALAVIARARAGIL